MDLLTIKTDKTPAAKSLYRSIFLDNDIWHCFLSVKFFYGLDYFEAAVEMLLEFLYYQTE
jgi:hypothetical protein